MLLDALREKIDACDQKLVDLLNQRYSYVREVGLIKSKSKSNYFIPEREVALLKTITAYNDSKEKGLLPNNVLKAIFREIMSGSLLLEASLKIAYLGPKGTFSHEALLKKFGNSIVAEPYSSIKDIICAVNQQEVHYALVPVYNSSVGLIDESWDTIANYACLACGEVILDIEHNLFSLAKDKSKIKKIYSHPKALEQCKRFLKEHFPDADLIGTSSTAKGIEHCLGDETVAAIGNVNGGLLYDVPCLYRAIGDDKLAYTRFFILSKQDTESTGDDKTSIIFSVADQEGSLLECLDVFREKSINLNMIKSKSARNDLNECDFYVDFSGHRYDENVAEALGKLRAITSRLIIIGSYPKALL